MWGRASALADIIFSVSFPAVVTGAAEPLILHNRTNGCDKLFTFPYGSVIVDATHLEDLFLIWRPLRTAAARRINGSEAASVSVWNLGTEAQHFPWLFIVNTKWLKGNFEHSGKCKQTSRGDLFLYHSDKCRVLSDCLAQLVPREKQQWACVGGTVWASNKRSASDLQGAVSTRAHCCLGDTDSEPVSHRWRCCKWQTRQLPAPPPAFVFSSKVQSNGLTFAFCVKALYPWKQAGKYFYSHEKKKCIQCAKGI